MENLIEFLTYDQTFRLIFMNPSPNINNISNIIKHKLDKINKYMDYKQVLCNLEMFNDVNKSIVDNKFYLNNKISIVDINEIPLIQFF